MGHLDGKVAIITGAGHGLGRAHAVALAREGARVVVNDLGVDASGAGGNREAAEETVRLVKETGSDAIAHYGDCAEWSSGQELVDLAVGTFGRLDILVNNAGFLRDRMPFNMTEQDWDAVIRVHLKGHFATTRVACAHWRDRAKAGEQVAGRIINTTSASGLFGNAGQPNYAAAKAGIVGLTLSLANAMGRYGVTANVIAPGAETRPEVTIEGMPDELRAVMTPEQVSPVVAYLASDAAAHISGQIFHVVAGRIDRVDGFNLVDGIFKAKEPWTVDELVERFGEIAGQNPPPPQAVLLRIVPPIARAVLGDD